MSGESRSGTRRHFVAAVAAAGLGLGTVGSFRRGDAETESPASTTRRETSTVTAAAAESEADSGISEANAEGDRSDALTRTPILGANLNGRPHRLLNNFELIDASNTTWVRAFLDVRNKLADGTAPENDPDVRALRRAARERNCSLVVSLKWDFAASWGDKEPARVPQPGSTDERALCRCARRYLDAIGVPLDVVVLGNEPMWETPAADIRVENPPIVRFTRAVKEHLVQYGDHGDPAYLVGSFNRAHDDDVRTRQFAHFYRELFEMAREDEDVDGVDLHIHYDRFAEAEKTVAVARDELLDGTIIVTEFSPVWRYARNVNTPISEFEAGERFALDHDLPAETTAVEYFEYAKRNPRPPEELGEFYDAMPWYNANHVEDVYDLFSEFGVSVATFGLLQGIGMRNEDWSENWTPFHINFLSQPALMRAESGVERTAHPLYIDDYRRRTGRDSSTAADA